jgi:hypothetical protein
VPSRDMSVLPEPNDVTTTLVRTLQTHCELGCNIARTAAALDVHLSTARYRLYRIRELTGFEPADRRSLSALLRITDGQVGLRSSRWGLDPVCSSSGGGDPDWLIELQNLLLSTRSLEDFLAQLTELAANTASRNSSASITLRHDKRPYTVVNSDALAAQVDVQISGGLPTPPPFTPREPTGHRSEPGLRSSSSSSSRQV